MKNHAKNLLVVLGPTASGKTRLGVRLARMLGGEIVSADSRQVYRGLDIGAGKDFSEYVLEGQRIAYHLIDVVNLDFEFSVFDFQKRCYQLFEQLRQRDVLPVLVGGTGLYLESVLMGYQLKDVAEDSQLRKELGKLSQAELVERLCRLKGCLHNTTDIEDRDRLMRAIEIVEKSVRDPLPEVPDLRALVLGIHWPREQLKQRIRLRLQQRMQTGLIEEVEGLLTRGVSRQRLYSLGLEYRYAADHLQGKIKNRNDLFQKLFAAICGFAKRQETWFRRMERKGFPIQWIERADFDSAERIVQQVSWVK